MRRSWVRSKSIFLVGLMSFQLYANETLPTGYIENLNAAYNTPKGSASADVVNIEGFGNYVRPQMDVENYKGLLIFSFEDKQFELDISMLGITDAERIDVGSLEFGNDDAKINLSLDGADAFDPTFRINIRNAFIECLRSDQYEDIKDDLLSACLSNSKISLGEAYFMSEDSEFYSLYDEYEIMGDTFDLQDLDVNVRNGKLKAEFRSSLSKGIKVKIEAETSYDTQNKRVVINLRKAKASFLNIKNTIFNELEKMDTEGLEVQRPYIYFNFSE